MGVSALDRECNDWHDLHSQFTTYIPQHTVVRPESMLVLSVCAPTQCLASASRSGWLTRMWNHGKPMKTGRKG